MENEIIDFARQKKRTPLHFLGWIGYLSFAIALFQVPWGCGLFRPAFDAAGGSFWWRDTMPFIIGHAIMVAPSILAMVLAAIALTSKRPGSYRAIARAALGIAMLLLFFEDYALKWHAGD